MYETKKLNVDIDCEYLNEYDLNENEKFNKIFSNL